MFQLHLKSLFIKVSDRGFVHIVLSSSVVKVVSFISAIFLPRIIVDKAEYGLLVYADNIMSYLLLLNGLGIAYSTLRYCAKAESSFEQKKIFLGTVLIGIIIDVIVIAISILLFITVPFPFSGARSLLITMAFIPILVFLFEDLQLFFRALFENAKYSILSIAYSALMVILQICLALVWSIKGVIIGRYLAVIIALIIGIALLKNINFFKTSFSLPAIGELRKMIKYGVTMTVTNATSLMMQFNEIFIIGLILKKSELLADYKIASYILTVSLFITQSVAIFIIPYFIKHSSDKQWILKTFRKLSSLNAVIMVPLHLVLILYSKNIITFAFGDQYANATFLMQILLLASLGQSVFRMLPGNILSVIGYESFNLRLNIIFLVIHALIDFWAVSNFGIAGAALGLIFVYFSSGIILTLYLQRVCKRTIIQT